MSKRATQNSDMSRFILKNVEVKEQYQIKVSERFVTLGNLDTNMDSNRAWENIK
jgi:hypothetical protein